MNIKKRKLKNYLLFPHIQFKLIIGALIATILSLGGAYFSVQASFNRLTDIGQKLNFPSNSGYFKLINAQQEIVFSNVMMASAVGIILTILIVILISHRALGPFYRIKIFFQNYESNSNDRIKFRDSDYFKQLEEDINRALK
ncbi:MAG: hypothetical protein KC493_04915 [Bacteriovoracaceae bacterium]|nr:hypothetical protein [Bacteriovoracaceae bacterium]